MKENKLVQHRDPGYGRSEFDPPFAGVRRRFLLVGRTLNTMACDEKSNPRAEYRLREIERINVGSERKSTASIKVSRGTLTGN